MIIRSCRPSALVALGVLGACSHAGVAPSAPSPARVASKPAVAVAAPVSAAPAATPAAAETAEPSPFIEGVRLGYAARFTLTGNHALLSTERLLLGIHDDQVAVEPALLEGLRPGSAQFPRVFGNLPDSAWAVQQSYAERTTRSSLSRWTGSEWQNADAQLRGRNIIGISAWSAGRSLALIGDEYAQQLSFVQLAGPRSGPVPQLERRAKNGYGCVHGVQPMAMTALPSGEVFLAGTRCSVSGEDEVTEHGVAVERWGAGQARGKVSVLPRLAEQDAASAELTSLVAVSASDVLVAGGRIATSSEGSEAKAEAYLAHFDGKAWQALPAPPVERIDELQRAPDGKLWALSGGDLWTTRSSALESATWESVPLPRLAEEAGEHAVSSFWVQDTGSVWATLGTDGFSYLVRTKRGAAPLSAPPDAQIAELSQALDPSAAYDCETPTLVLLTLSRQAPKDADMPSVRAALRGHSELAGKAQFIELPFLTRRYLAARGDLDTLRETREVLVRANIPGVDPELRCLSGQATRILPMDFEGPKPALPKAARTVSSNTDREHVAPIDFQF